MGSYGEPLTVQLLGIRPSRCMHESGLRLDGALFSPSRH